MVASSTGSKPRIVIVGAGFGGLTLAENLASLPVEVVLIDRNNYHTFQPLLYQVATAGLEPEEIAHSVRGVFHEQENLRFRLGTVVDLDREDKYLTLLDGTQIDYDYLVLAAGTSTNYFGTEGAEEHSFGLKTLEDAVALRSHVIRQFERADRNPDLIEDGALTFVVVGGGPTGVETAGALMELFQMVFTKDFTHLAIDRAKVVLIELSDRVLGTFSESLSEYTRKTLVSRGVDVRLGTPVVEATNHSVILEDGTTIPTHTLVWAAGVTSAPLADQLGLERERNGRVIVNGDLSLPDHPDVFVIGDLAASKDEDGQFHPQVAPLAIQGGKYVASILQARTVGQEEFVAPFSYFDKGSMATIGRHAAVTEIPKPNIKLTGWLAWLAWLGLHLIMLIGFRNRVQVLVNWMWNYITYDRSARLIMGPPRITVDQLPLGEQPSDAEGDGIGEEADLEVVPSPPPEETA